MGNSSWEWAETLGGWVGGAYSTLSMSFNHETLMTAKQLGGTWSTRCLRRSPKLKWAGSAHLSQLPAKRNKTNKHKGRSNLWCNFQLPNKCALTVYKRSFMRNMKEVNADWRNREPEEDLLIVRRNRGGHLMWNTNINLILKSCLLSLSRLTEILLQQTINSDPFHELGIFSRSKACAF